MTLRAFDLDADKSLVLVLFPQYAMDRVREKERFNSSIDETLNRTISQWLTQQFLDYQPPYMMMRHARIGTE